MACWMLLVKSYNFGENKQLASNYEAEFYFINRNILEKAN